MKERPILMSGPMVQAIMKGWKTETRRIIKLREFQPSDLADWDWDFRDRHGLWNSFTTETLLENGYCPYGVVGDRLWVREGHRFFEAGNGVDYIQYRADEKPMVIPNTQEAADFVVGKLDEKWRPSIHMPRWASRLLLEVKDVRVERLQDITTVDIHAEGWPREGPELPSEWFTMLWQRLNVKRGFPWKSNPWVWVVVFRGIDD